jgi:hypothetical protein
MFRCATACSWQGQEISPVDHEPHLGKWFFDFQVNACDNRNGPMFRVKSIQPWATATGGYGLGGGLIRAGLSQFEACLAAFGFNAVGSLSTPFDTNVQLRQSVATKESAPLFSLNGRVWSIAKLTQAD